MPQHDFPIQFLDEVGGSGMQVFTNIHMLVTATPLPLRPSQPALRTLIGNT